MEGRGSDRKRRRKIIEWIKMEKIRLQKFLSQAGIASRRKSENLISSGKILINNKIAILGDKIDPHIDVVKVDGEVIQSSQQLVYYAVNKPVEYTSSVRDVNAKKLVTELVHNEPKVWPVGRLDKDSTGLIILTNDGELTNKLTHPRYRHEKEYLIKCRMMNAPLEDTRGRECKINDKINKLKKGIILTEGIAHFDKLEIVDLDEKRNIATIRVVLHQGWKRQIRRMCEKVGFYVVELKRTRIAKLELGNLEKGKYKVVNKSDII